MLLLSYARAVMNDDQYHSFLVCRFSYLIFSYCHCLFLKNLLSPKVNRILTLSS